ncbi:MAG TPA: type II toxin-antitoxin system mRNA interferase toxin, RelE/StbE family [Candidatus Paceibacterota bacterium]|nr:type II toxin-antitoxin system mRNA interferase toxin, RelE/StbE family [Candidatus Paceibacterota bacterium]
MKIFYTSKFAREYKKLNVEIQDLADQKIEIFKENQFSTQLKTHKLHGSLSNYYAFSVDMRIRVIFRYGSKREIYLHSIGDHGIYD